MTDLGARAMILSVIWASIGLAISVGFATRADPEVIAAITLFLTAGATLVSLVVWLTRWPAREQARGFEVTQVRPANPVPVGQSAAGPIAVGPIAVGQPVAAQ
jgi:hypothetical protein